MSEWVPRRPQVMLAPRSYVETLLAELTQAELVRDLEQVPEPFVWLALDAHFRPLFGWRCIRASA